MLYEYLSTLTWPSRETKPSKTSICPARPLKTVNGISKPFFSFTKIPFSVLEEHRSDYTRQMTESFVVVYTGKEDTNQRQ